ncbi:hypothetical protein FF38_04351 [Lucilia cuprina]|uniref:MADF domain-containing protein n=1 Tax=Lucilia cuprina TaxID=7375 RepID=A0A0L0C9K8_LUCCU|nr:hypothetical protein FF38_04351 [Lucilia cuprina]
MSRIDEKRSLETSRGVVDYMTIDLIKQIERHPVIWDRLHQDYKSGDAKSVSWHAIGRVFVPFYDDIDEDEQRNITQSLKNRWNNCVKGLMKAVTLKRKNDRRFSPFKYTREMKFYLEMRGMQISDIYDAEENIGIEENQIKKENYINDEDEEEDIEPIEECEKMMVDEQQSPKNKNNKTADTLITYRSARLREKQTGVEKSSPEKKSNTNKTQIKTTPITINGSVCYSMADSNTSKEENDKEDFPHYGTPQLKKQKTSAAVNDSVNILQNSHQTLTFSNESDAADQAFFDSIKPALPESLKNRWRNCVGGLMSSVTMKRKNDRLFCPFKYTREMEFYLEMRGMKLSDIYDEQENEEIEKIEVKKENNVEEDDAEIEENNEEEKKTKKLPPKNKKNKTAADTSITFRSARLREKQTAAEKSSPEKITSTPKNTKQKPSKTVPTVSNNVSVCQSLGENNFSNEVEENIKEDDHPPYNYIPQAKKAKISAAVNHSVDIPQNSHQFLTFTQESEAFDQAFFDSIKPALRKMNETQKLDFQIDILQILKTFRTN